MPKKYFARLSKSTAAKRKAFWNKLGKYPFTKSEYEKAEKVPGDSKETRSSKYNKDYREKFGVNEVFEMEQFYSFWGWIKPDGSLLMPTKEQKDNPRSLSSHLTILPSDLNNQKANDFGWYRFVIPKGHKKLHVFNNGKGKFDPQIILTGVRKIVDSIVKEKYADVFKSVRLPEIIEWNINGNNGSVELDPTLRQLNTALKKIDVVESTLYTEEKKRSITALQKKSKASGVPYSILKKVYDRGMAAWVTGHRPGATQHAWAFARVNSFLTKGKTWYGPDADLAKKARKYLKEETQSKVSYAWYWHPIEGILIQTYDPMSSLGKHDSMASKYGFEDIDEFPRGQFYVDNSAVNTYTDGPFTSITTYNWAGKEYQDKMPKDVYKLIRKKLKIPSSYKHYSNDTKKWIEEAHIFDYTDWGWISPDGKSFKPLETDGTHTAILRRLAENPKLTRYGLSQKETEYSATGKGWVRWLLDNNELRFNTTNWNTSIPVQRAMLDIVNKYLSAREFSFEWADKDRIGNNLYRRIEVQNSGDFILKLSGERRKRLMSEDQDYEIEMISGQLKKIIDLSTDTLNIIQNQSEIPAWIQDKVSVSVHNAEAIFDYYHYSESIQEQVDIDSAINKILERAKQKFPKLYPKIEAAYKLANMAHEGQFRKSTGSKYIIHPMEVFNSAMDYGFTDEPTLLAAILHDVMEDGPSSITFESLSKEFGRATAITVKLLSKAFSAEDSPDKVKVDHDTYFTNLKTAPISVKNIKALDRLDNVKDIDEFSPKKLANYVPETQELLKIFGKDVPNVSADIMKRIAPYIEEYGIKEPIQEETQMKKVVIFPGGYHPFHKGHYSVYSAIKKEFPEADVYIASTNTQNQRPFSFEDKKYLARQLGVPEESFVQVKIPYVAKEITGNYDPKNTVLIFALSEKDSDRISYTKKDGTPGYFAKWNGKDVQPFESKGYIYITPKMDFKVAGKVVDSASKIRKMYAEADDETKIEIINDMYPGGDAEEIKKILDKNLSESIQESVQIISETIRCSKKTGKKICFVFSKKGKKLGGPYSETKAKKRLRQIEYFKHLNK